MTNPENTTTTSSGGTWLLVLIVVAGLGIAAFAFGLIKVDQTQEAKAPVFDVSTAKIDVGKREATVKVPTVDVGSTDQQVTVPTVTVEPAKDPE
jgi:uncharacterized protein HemX